MSSEQVAYRQADHSEIGALALVYERAIAGRDGSPLPIAVEDASPSFDEILSRMERIAAWTCVAACGEKIVGFALSHPLLDTKYADVDSDTEHLSFLMVDPDYWGQRVGSRLLDITAEHARENAKRRVTLWTREPDNARARSVYEHKGFTLTGVHRTTENGPQVQYQLDL